MKMPKFGKSEFLKDVLTVFVGAGVGVVADKIVGDVLLAGNIPNPAIYTVQTHDVVLIGAELAGAHYAKKRGRRGASKFLTGMATAVVATDVYEAVVNSGRWFSMSYLPPPQNLSYGGGRYGKMIQQPSPTVFRLSYPRR